MTREEALARIKELENYIESLDKQVSYKNDEIFLLSVEEYEKYKQNIPLFRCYWWLRSPGNYRNDATDVLNDGSVYYHGDYVDYDTGCVRPALRIPTLESSNLKIGDRIIKYAYPWIYLGDNIAVAETPIATYRFDSDSNVYETSEIRQFLIDWLKGRRNDDRGNN